MRTTHEARIIFSPHGTAEECTSILRGTLIITKKEESRRRFIQRTTTNKGRVIQVTCSSFPMDCIPVLPECILGSEPPLLGDAVGTTHVLQERRSDLCKLVAASTICNNPLLCGALKIAGVHFAHPFNCQSVNVHPHLSGSIKGDVSDLAVEPLCHRGRIACGARLDASPQNGLPDFRGHVR